jgi:uncharacterized membrane protein
MTPTCKSQLLYRTFKCNVPYSVDRILTRLRPGRSVVRTWAGRKVFFFSQNKTGSGGRPLYNSDTGCFAGVRHPGRQAYRLPVSSAEVKSCTSPLSSVFMASRFSLNCTDDRQCTEAEIEGLLTVPILCCDDTTCDCVDTAQWRHNLWLCRYCAVTTQLVTVLILRSDDTSCDCADTAQWRHILWLCRYCAVTTHLVTVPILRSDDTTPIYSSYFLVMSFRYVALDVTKRTVATGQLHCNAAEVITSSYLSIYTVWYNCVVCGKVLLVTVPNVNASVPDKSQQCSVELTKSHAVLVIIVNCLVLWV